MDAPGDGSRAGHHGICGMNAGRIHRCGDNYKIDAGLKFEAIRVKTTDFAALRVSMVGSVSGILGGGQWFGVFILQNVAIPGLAHY